MTESPVLKRVRKIVEPIASDLQLHLYDVEQRGGTLRITLDTFPGSPGSVDLAQLALATRLISREFDHEDPMPGKYTLEVSSPGVERNLRLPEHFQREIGKLVTVRLANVEAAERRLEGELIAADETTITLRVAATKKSPASDRVIEIAGIDRAKTVFVWGPAPKPGSKGAKRVPVSPESKTSGTTVAPAVHDELDDGMFDELEDDDEFDDDADHDADDDDAAFDDDADDPDDDTEDDESKEPS
jgi:ribosome maturation factor RimP